MNLSEDTRTVVRRPPPVPALHVAHAALQKRVERVLVRALPQARYQLMRVGPAGLTGLAVLIAAGIAAIALLLPAHQSIVGLRAELTKAGHATPAAAQPQNSPQQFAAALPTRDRIPALLGVVLVQAADAGIVLEQGKYAFSPAATPSNFRSKRSTPTSASSSTTRWLRYRRSDWINCTSSGRTWAIRS
jgi:hypothetical protein